MADETNAGGDASGAMSIDDAAQAILGLARSSDKPTKEAKAPPPATPETEDAEDDEGSPDEGHAEASDADEDEEADEDGSEDEAEEKAPDYAPETAKVKLPDGSETTVADLMKGSLRQADYTRKTQELSEERKRVRQMEEKIETFSQTILERLQTAEKLAERAKPAPPPESLYDTDPVQYLMMERLYERAMREWENDYQSTVEGIRQTLSVRDETKQSRTNEELEAGRKKLREAIPDLADDAKKASVIRDIVAVAEKAGFTAEDVNGWSDPRVAILAHMASKAHKLEQAKPKAEKKVSAAPPVQKAGQRASPKDTARSKYRTDRNRLAQTKSIDDAAAAIFSGGLYR